MQTKLEMLANPAIPSPKPAPGRRPGPRPLAMHLALANLRSSGCESGWPGSNADWQNLIERLSRVDLRSLTPDAALIHGIAAYRRHPWMRDIESPEPVWAEGETILRDHGGHAPSDKNAAAILLVPSLVNRATIMDLASGQSMARDLAARGLRVFLLDWGWPDLETRKLDLDALITGRLARAIAEVAARTGGRVTLAGYCMGGLLTTAAAQLSPDNVAGLALLATPWNFHAGSIGAPADIARALESFEPVMAMAGTLPIDLLQALFSLSEPHAVGDKYRAFGTADQDTPRARQFVLVEDWLNDGVPLAAPVARQCLKDWYVDNAPARGTWRVAGESISPASLRLPCFAAIPGNDRIVPPESAAALAASIPGSVSIHPKAGHIGMVAGSSAHKALWAPLAEWALGVPARPFGFRKRRRAAKLGA
jgi:polyhydroxyalkanoate synthase